MTEHQDYPVGTPGVAWTSEDKSQWLARQCVKRSYQHEVLDKIQNCPPGLELVKYGELPYDIERYPLFVFKSADWNGSKKTILVTGGVHGYETSGVQGAIRFALEHAENYLGGFNLIIAPCLSPWGYETINRWNPNAVDPNRSFYADTPSAEAGLLMAYVESLNTDVYAHFDLHETTDTDNSEFRPALAARDGTVHDNWNIPDGFYLVGDTQNPEPEFQRHIIEAVERVTHIAPADDDGKIIGAPLEQKGVINYDKKALGLCGGFANANYVTTTEVYPDSPEATDANCIQAQVVAICSGLDYLLEPGT